MDKQEEKEILSEVEQIRISRQIANVIRARNGEELLSIETIDICRDMIKEMNEKTEDRIKKIIAGINDGRYEVR